MVKLRGPIGSAGASGSFGRSTTFSSWKGRAYARVKTIPTNPKSPMQVSSRAMMGFLSAAWATLTAPQKATWIASAAAALIPPYNQFISANLARWSEFRAPGKDATPSESGTQAEYDTHSAAGAPGHADIFGTWYDRNDGWGIMIFRSLSSGFATSLETCVAVIPHVLLDGKIYTDEGLAPGTYYYNLRTFTTEGGLSAPLGQVTAVVT